MNLGGLDVFVSKPKCDRTKSSALTSAPRNARARMSSTSATARQPHQWQRPARWIGKYHNRYSPVTPIEEFEYFGFVLQIIQSNGNVKPINNKRLFYRVQLLCRRPGVRPCAWRTYYPAAGPRACGQSRLRAIRCPAGIMKNSWGRGQDWGATDWTEQESTARVSVEGRSILIVRSADNR